MPKLTPFLWFDHEAEDAARFYLGVFPNSRITTISHYGESGPGPAGTVMTVAFELDGKAFVALNGGPHYQINGAISFVIDCATQAEVDRYWDLLTADGGKTHACGWLTDKFGVTWQVVPDGFIELVTSPDPVTATRAMAAMREMIKLDIDALRRAVEG
ncbi:VOC family protein [Nitrospirillum iridis]|uniref:Putative 3-demethylubiquinone-9 3-methyltransferase (Glyoxalase superfamily) n=1 Tax=Nitrospirillum iridis TaxID=765888 RepID=A0A7X0EDH4_9PROT|nr:VOC family protein [Nitrospirillum iridis]MBB6252748.1 putative 3-demethylubiquinone-9 3-methyltransferase (glyoxalase superfamily) [Nitrospirillum iridis]